MPISETRNCQNCKTSFSIDASDFDFYKKINVPPPTFCAACRLQRRLMVRNERNFYKRECGLCEKSIISMYSSEKPFPVYCSECWWGDGWDPLQYGADYDWSKPFFEQIHELQMRVPRPSLRNTNNKNSDYCNYVADGKNCYLCFGSIEVEDCMYGCPYESKYCVDTYLVRECEFCYECLDCEKLSNCLWCQECATSLNLLFCYDCKNCHDCVGCIGLRNKQYHIFNQAYSKEDYERERKKIFSGGRSEFSRVAVEFEKIKKNAPHRFATTLQCASVSGDHIVQSKNAQYCFDVKHAEDSKYCVRLINAKDTYDTNYCEYLELCYDYLGFWKVQRTKFSNTCGEGSDMTYCDFCSGTTSLFGCVGLRQKQYCILNKQYSKEEYEDLVTRIQNHMGSMPYHGTNGKVYAYGEFFPAELSLLAYNESVAQDFFPLSREGVVTSGFTWKEPEGRSYSVTLKTADIPARIEYAPDSITEEIIGCEHGGACHEQCTTAFRVMPGELQFYRRMHLPLPLLCPNCRHYKRLGQRNQLKLWHRQCQCFGTEAQSSVYKNTAEHIHGAERCLNEFETSYAPDRPEIVYCEQCYNAEIV